MPAYYHRDSPMPLLVIVALNRTNDDHFNTTILDQSQSVIVVDRVEGRHLFDHVDQSHAHVLVVERSGTNYFQQVHRVQYLAVLVQLDLHEIHHLEQFIELVIFSLIEIFIIIDDN